MPGNLTLAALAEEVAQGTIDTVNVALVDMQGRLLGKRCHAGYFLQNHEEGHISNYVLAVDINMEPVPGYKAASWAQGYGDYLMKPDLTTLRRTPWLPGTALVICDLLDHQHQEVSHSPRAMLKKQIARLDARGWTAKMASELEFYLFNETYIGAHAKGYRNLNAFMTFVEDYGILPTTMNEHIMREVRLKLAGAGIEIENSKGEWGAGQEELNVRYQDALAMADDHTVIKTGIKEIAYLNNAAVTFMAKYAYDCSGSSAHVHQSLWSKTGTPLFLDQSAEGSMSKLMRHYLAGLLTYAREITWFLAPFINSYKRFQAGTFAPTKAVWSHDNRTAGFRVVGDGTKAVRTECRIGGADLNPYLAFAAMIAAGLAGIEEELELEPAVNGDAYHTPGIREVPKTLREATETLNNSKMLRTAFGDDVIDHYVHTAKWEQFEYDRRVTDWELIRGFERY